MKRILLVLLSLTAFLVVGCGGGTPKATAPETKVDFGNVVMTNDMNDVKRKEFFIKNEGTADLKLSDLQVKLLEGCWPPRVTVGSTVIKPGKQTSFVFPYQMHPGMGGKHYFQVRVKTNDPANPELVFHVYGNSVDK